jgi:hypothetical protein
VLIDQKTFHPRYLLYRQLAPVAAAILEGVEAPHWLTLRQLRFEIEAKLHEIIAETDPESPPADLGVQVEAGLREHLFALLRWHINDVCTPRRQLRHDAGYFKGWSIIRRKGVCQGVAHHRGKTLHIRTVEDQEWLDSQLDREIEAKQRGEDPPAREPAREKSPKSILDELFQVRPKLAAELAKDEPGLLARIRKTCNMRGPDVLRDLDDIQRRNGNLLRRTG